MVKSRRVGGACTGGKDTEKSPSAQFLTRCRSGFSGRLNLSTGPERPLRPARHAKVPLRRPAGRETQALERNETGELQKWVQHKDQNRIQLQSEQMGSGPSQPRTRSRFRPFS